MTEPTNVKSYMHLKQIIRQYLYMQNPKNSSTKGDPAFKSLTSCF